MRGCDVCGSYLGVAPADKSGGHWLCAEHAHRAATRSALWTLAVYAILAGVAAAVSSTSPLAAAALVPVAAAVLTVARAAAQAGLAALTGLRVTRIGLGTGPRLVSFRAGPRIDVRALPTAVSVDFVPRGDPRRWRWRLAWLAAVVAGPAVDVAALVAAVRGGGAAGVALGVTAGWAAVGWLVGDPASPHESSVAVLRQQGFQVPVLSDTPEGWSVTYDEVLTDADAVLRAVRAGQPPDRAALARLRAVYPDEPYWQAVERDALLAEGRWDEARAAFTAARPDATGTDLGRVANALAWIGAITGTDLDAAARDAALAVELLSDERADDPFALVAAYDTAALVAARQGRLDDAAELAARAVAAGGPYRDRLHGTAAYIAWRRGDAEAYERELAAARAVDPDDPVLALIG